MDKFSYLSNAGRFLPLKSSTKTMLMILSLLTRGGARFFEGFEFAKNNYEEESTPSGFKNSICRI